MKCPERPTPRVWLQITDVLKHDIYHNKQANLHPGQPLHLQISNAFRLAIEIVTLTCLKQDFFVSMNSCRLSNLFIICMAMHHSKICIHTWGTLSFCFHPLPNKRSITDIQRNYDKQEILSLFALIAHCLNFNQAVHQFSVRAMNPLGLFSDYFNSFLHLLILRHPFQNGYVCHAYISPQFPRCSCLKFKLNIVPRFPFSSPKDLPTPCLFWPVPVKETFGSETSLQ